MAAGDLTSFANAQSWVPGLDPQIGARLITAVSTAIQNWVSYQIASQSYSRTFNGNGGNRLMLPDIPVTAVASVTIDGQSISPAADATSFGFVFDTRAVYLRGERFCRGVQNVSVIYTAGYAQIPYDIEQACILWVQASNDALTRAPGVTKLKAGGSEIDYGPDLAMAGNSLIAPMPATVYAMLQPYSRVYPS